jgi:hypothetical protein
MLDITSQLTSVHGGNADLLRRGQVMQNYTNCVKTAQTALNTGNEASMAAAQTNPTAGMTQMLGTGATFQRDMASCAKQFPIK